MKTTKITYFRDLFNAKDTSYPTTLENALKRIKTGKNKELISKIRLEKDKSKRDKLKQQLPCILFSGEFNERSKKGLVKHSGLMVLDFDNVTEINYKSQLSKNKHIICVFVSPSGNNGLKAVIKIPECNSKEHTQYYKAFIKQFDLDFIDSSGSDVSRVCFESYDKDIYINYEAEIFKPTLIDEGFKHSEKVSILPISEESNIVEKIMRFDWKRDFNEGERNNFIFDLASMFSDYGVSQSFCEGYLLNNVIHGDFNEREAKNTIKSAYRSRKSTFNSKYFEDYKKIESIKASITKKQEKEEILEDFNIDEDVFDEIKEEIETEDFWFFTKKGIKISPIKYKRFLMRNGFRKHYANGSDEPTLVFVKSNKVEVTSRQRIKDFVLNYLEEKNEFEVWDYVANYQNLFSDNYLNFLESIDLIMLNDTKDETFIAYENGILKITKNDFELIDFIEVDGFIWKSNILPREFKPTNNIENDYKQFIKNISNESELPIECVIGYLINTYKNRSNNKAIILNDEVISENPEGGTGKGLFIQGISHIRKTHIIDGKKYNEKSQFSNQTISLDDKVLVFDDVKKNWNFEAQFSDVTEGITIERKNKDAVKLNVHESPKIVISTNYAIKGEGTSHNRRRHEIEVAQFYNENNTPQKEFGRELFDDWSIKDFNCFDNYIVSCVQSYMKNGLVKQNAKNLKKRKFISETSMDFLEWIEDEFNFKRDEYVKKSDAYNDFTTQYKDFDRANWFTRKRFHIWVEKYAKYKDYKFLSENNQLGRCFYLGTTDKIKEPEILF